MWNWLEPRRDFGIARTASALVRTVTATMAVLGVVALSGCGDELADERASSVRQAFTGSVLYVAGTSRRARSSSPPANT
jgi:hypothetical protein